MGTNSHVRGVLAEVRAEQMLSDQGYEILARNFKVQGSEIDLIALDGNCVVFAEVKMRTKGAVSGREAVTPAKQKRICKGAVYYLMQQGLMNRQVRFDVIEIHNGNVSHIVNAFPYQEPAF